MTREFDIFEQLVCDALQSDEQPSSDFAAAVMARVAQTPQRKPIRYGRIATGVAACLMVAFIATIPLRWRAGSAASKEAAAPQSVEESMVMSSAADSGNYEAAAEAEEAPAAGSQSSAISNSAYDTYGGLEAAKNAALDKDIEAMPRGLDTPISADGQGVSGGQRQRILIARALIRKPRIFLLDEATSALDNISQHIITENLARMKCTRITIAHRMSTIRECNRIIVLDGGKVAEDGSFDELVAKGGLFSDIIKRQMV